MVYEGSGGTAAGLFGAGGAADSGSAAAAGGGMAGGGGAAVGGDRQSVCRWARKLKRGGERALGAGRLGRPARLHREDLRRLESRLKRGPGAVGYGRWTAVRVGELIERECRVKYDPSQAWRILRRMGWSWRGGGGGWRITRSG